jgi:hypothetical protein
LRHLSTTAEENQHDAYERVILKQELQDKNMILKFASVFVQLKLPADPKICRLKLLGGVVQAFESYEDKCSILNDIFKADLSCKKLLKGRSVIDNSNYFSEQIFSMEIEELHLNQEWNLMSQVASHGRTQDEKIVSFSAFNIQNHLRTLMETALLNADVSDDELRSEAERKLQASSLDFLDTWSIDLEALDIPALEKILKAVRDKLKNVKAAASKSTSVDTLMMQQHQDKEAAISRLRQRNQTMLAYSGRFGGADTLMRLTLLQASLRRALRRTHASLLQASARRALSRRCALAAIAGESPGTEGGKPAPAALYGSQRARWSGWSADGDTTLLSQKHQEGLLEEELLEDQLRRLGVALD